MPSNNQVSDHFSSLVETLKASLAARKLKAEGASPGALKVQRYEDRVEFCPEHGPWVRYVADASGVMRARPGCPGCARQAGVKQARINDIIPERFASASFETYETLTFHQESTLSLVVNHAQDVANRRDSGGLILWGGSGTGKSHLAVSYLRHAVSHGLSGYYTTAWALLDRIHRSRQFNAERDEIMLIDRLAKVDLLVIEDVGKSAHGEREAAQFFALMDARWAACKPTIITTNEPPEALRGLLTPAGYERLANGAKIIHLDWVSRRMVAGYQPTESPMSVTEPRVKARLY